MTTESADAGLEVTPALAPARRQRWRAADVTQMDNLSCAFPSIDMPRRRGLFGSRHRILTAAALSAIVIGSALLSTVWVFRVPIFQSPDEPQHFDYAIALYENGGLIRANHFAEVKAKLAHFNHYGFSFLCYFCHPYTTHLIEQSEHGSIAATAACKVPPDYGSAAFYGAIDRAAPAAATVRMDVPPSLAFSYPFGYYGLVALWIASLRLFTDSLVATFFGARLLSVALLAAGLLASYATLRELRFSRRFSLFVTACMGFFPLTSFVSSYVQPDNLGFPLASLCFFFTLRWRRNLESKRCCARLGVALALLLITKPHFFLCVSAPCLAMLSVEMFGKVGIGRRLVLWGILLVGPSILLGSVAAWVAWGSGFVPLPMASSPNRFLSFLEGMQKAFHDFYAGSTHHSFWGIFGWMDAPLVIRDPSTTAAVQILIQVTSWILLALTMIRLENIVSRLVCVAWKGRWPSAARVALSNPPINSYFLFTGFMFALHIATNNYFGGQGRNWFPFLMPIFLTGLAYAPKALTLPRIRRAFCTALLVGLGLYCSVGSYYALETIEQRYYAPNYDRPMCELPVGPKPIQVNQMTWKDRVGEGTGIDPYLVFELAQPAYVYCIHLKYRLHNIDDTASFFQVFWMEQGRNVFDPTERNSVCRIRTKESEKTLTVWINDQIDRFRLDPDMKPCHFEILDMKVLGR